LPCRFVFISRKKRINIEIENNRQTRTQWLDPGGRVRRSDNGHITSYYIVIELSPGRHDYANVCLLVACFLFSSSSRAWIYCCELTGEEVFTRPGLGVLSSRRAILMKQLLLWLLKLASNSSFFFVYL
jgi:hypothetical protein